MTFEELKDIIVDTLSCDADKVTMEASLADDLQADSLDAVELNMAHRGSLRRFHPRRRAAQHEDRRRYLQLRHQ